MPAMLPPKSIALPYPGSVLDALRDPAYVALVAKEELRHGHIHLRSNDACEIRAGLKTLGETLGWDTRVLDIPQYRTAEDWKVIHDTAMAAYFCRTWDNGIPALEPPQQFYIKMNYKCRELFRFDTPAEQITHRVIVSVLQGCREWPANSHGYLPGRGVHTAIAHLSDVIRHGYRYFEVLDAENAFKSMKRERVINTFGAALRKQAMAMGCTSKDADEAAALAKIIDFHEVHSATALTLPALCRGAMVDVSEYGLLPGLSTSPPIFNFCLARLDKMTANCAIRYADDWLVYGRTEAELEMARNKVMEYGRDAYGLNIRSQTGVIDLRTDVLTFLGLETQIDKNIIFIRISQEKMDEVIETLSNILSENRYEKTLLGIIRYYCKYGWLTQKEIVELGHRLRKALNRSVLVNSKRIKRLLRNQQLNRFLCRAKTP